MLRYFRDLKPCLIGMEACSSANYWARELQQLGHTVKLIAPQFVKPYVKGNKNDANDAEAICEAVSRSSMRYVAIKTIAQQDLQATNRVRSALVQQRTAKANQIRGLLAEYGVAFSQSIAALRRSLPILLEDTENSLTSDFRILLKGLQEDLQLLDQSVSELDKRIQKLANSHPDTQRLQQIPGIGPVTATALVSAVGDGRQFNRVVTCQHGWV